MQKGIKRGPAGALKSVNLIQNFYSLFAEAILVSLKVALAMTSLSLLVLAG